MCVCVCVCVVLKIQNNVPTIIRALSSSSDLERSTSVPFSWPSKKSNDNPVVSAIVMIIRI